MNKLTVNREEFHARLSRAFEFVPDKLVIPMFESFKLTVTKNTVEILAADPKMQIRLWCPCDSNADFQICIPAGILLKTVALYRSETITITQKTDKIVEMKNGRSKNTISMDVMPADFGPMPFSNATSEITIHQSMLLKALKICKAMINPKHVNGNYTVVNMAEIGNKIIFTALRDGSLVRMSVRPIGIQHWSPIMLHLETTARLIAMLGDSGEINVVNSGDKAMFYTSGDQHSSFQMITTTHNGKFPDSERFFATELPDDIIANVSDFEDAVKRTKLYNGKDVEFPIVTISNKENSQEFSFVASDPDSNHTGEETMAITNLKPSAFHKTIGNDLLLNAIKFCDSAEMNIKFDQESDRIPICISPKVENQEEDLLRFLIMGIK